jgi:mannose-6-phosphate isomerase-like protein (cupin superfamily)
MTTINRRELSVALAALATVGGFSAGAQVAAPAGTEPLLAHSEIFPFDHLTPKTGANGMVSRAVLHGDLATGEFVEVHETTLQPGQMPHPPHRHTHSEFLLIREGKVEVMSDGKTGLVGVGGVIFTASGVLHSLKNVGEVPATYFVVAVGVQHVIA